MRATSTNCSAWPKRKDTHFLVRTCVDRLAGTGNTTIARKMKREPIQGTHQSKFSIAKRRPIEVELQLRYSQMTVHPPIGKHKKYPPLSLTVIHAWERGKPEGRKPICWKLLTDLPVEDLDSAIEKAPVVLAAVENRDISQSAQVGLSGGRRQAAHGRATDEPDRRVLHHCVAGVLADDGPSNESENVGRRGVYRDRNRDPQPLGRRSRAPPPKNVAHYLLAVAKTRRLPRIARTMARPATRSCGVGSRDSPTFTSESN